jgi:hypothetical protein
VLPLAVGTQVLITALRGAFIADPTIPLPTLVDLWSILATSFLFTEAVAVPSSIILEVASFKVAETAKLEEFNVLNFSSVVVDCFVKVDDF